MREFVMTNLLSIGYGAAGGEGSEGTGDGVGGKTQ
jgi:hypothetical protein